MNLNFFQKTHRHKDANDYLIEQLHKPSILYPKGNITLLEGAWGSGKTFRWKRHIEPLLPYKNIIYISLFGMTSVQNLKQELYGQIGSKIAARVAYILCFCICILLFAFGFAALVSWDNLIPILKDKDMNLVHLTIAIFLISGLLILGIYLVLKFVLDMHLCRLARLTYSLIPVTYLLPPENTFLCFDDFERIAAGSSGDDFLGYFNKLARDDGYHILFIAHTTENTAGTQLAKYKEKLFDYVIEHQSNIEQILAEQQLDDTVRQYLITLFGKFDEASKHLDKFDETSKKQLEKVRGNIRVLLKIIANLKTVFEAVKPEILKGNKTFEPLIHFVGALSVAKETGLSESAEQFYSNYREVYVFHDEPNRKQKFMELLHFEPYEEFHGIYDLIYIGKKTQCFIEETTPWDQLTAFEKEISKYAEKCYDCYCWQEIQAYAQRFQDILNKQKVLFSSYTMIGKTLDKYACFLAYQQKNFTMNNYRTLIRRGIHNFLSSHPQPLVAYSRLPVFLETQDQNYRVSLTFLADCIYAKNLQIFMQSLNNTEKFVDTYCSYDPEQGGDVKDIACLVVMHDNHYIDLANLAQKNYATFCRIWHKVMEYRIYAEEYQHICKALNAPRSAYREVIQKFEKIFQDLAKGKPDHSPESRNYQSVKPFFEILQKHAEELEK